MSERLVASPLTMVKTLIWASAAGRLSNCRTRPSSKSRFSGGEEITRALARTSAVMRTSVRIPEFSSLRPLASTVRKRSMAVRCSFCPRPGVPGALPPCAPGTFWPWPGRLSARPARLPALAELLSALSARGLARAAGRDPDRRLHDRGDVLGERVFQPNDPHLVDRLAAGNVDLPNQFGNLGHVAGAGLDDQGGGPRVRRDVDRRAQSAAIDKGVLDRRLRRDRRGVFEMEDLELGPGNRRLVETGDELLHRFHVFRTADDQDRVGHRQGRDAHGALPRQVNFVIQGLDQGGHGLAIRCASST